MSKRPVIQPAPCIGNIPIEKTERAVNSMTQVKNPKSGRSIKINKDKGVIISHKKSDGPYKNIPILD